MGQPIIFLRDPELIKRLTVKDFDYFSDHRAIFDEKLDSLFGSSLVSLKGQKWRDMRSTLSPAFTGSKMRQMFELISICGDNLSKHFLLEAAKNNKLEYEMKDIFTRFANDVIATSAFGIQVDSFKDRNNEFYVTGKKLADFSSPLVIFKFIGHALMPKIMKFFKIRLVDSLISDYFTAIITSSMKYREENGIFRPDMLNLLMKVKQGKSETHPEEAANATTDGFATVEESSVGKAVVKTQWTDEELIAQCFIFFLAGFDAVSSAISYLAYEIAVNKDVEQKLYAEIEDINRQLNGQPLGYDTLQSMKYLDMVVSEALRKWAPSPVTDRICVKDYVYKDSDGLKFKIMKGDSCWIPTYGLHHDPKYFPNPRKFDPERFSDENKHNINMGAYQPFGSGPRNCIGKLFYHKKKVFITFSGHYYRLSIRPNGGQNGLLLLGAEFHF